MKSNKNSNNSFKKELRDLLKKHSVSINFECYDTQGISGERMVAVDKQGNVVEILNEMGMDICVSDLD